MIDFCEKVSLRSKTGYEIALTDGERRAKRGRHFLDGPRGGERLASVMPFTQRQRRLVAAGVLSVSAIHNVIRFDTTAKKAASEN